MASATVHHDLLDAGERCAPNTVARIMRSAGLRAQVGHKRRPSKYGTKPAVVAANRLQRDFDVDGPDRVWGSQPAVGSRAANDITYIRTHRGWLYLAAVIDLFSRKVVGWLMQPRMHTRLALDALMMAVWMAVWRRRPEPGVVVHSDQGSQFSSQEWRSFLEAHELVPSMSRRGNCYDNAVAESFFHLLKTERIRRKTYTTRADARQDIFNYVEMFDNPRRRHANNGMLSPDQFEREAS